MSQTRIYIGEGERVRANSSGLDPSIASTGFSMEWHLRRGGGRKRAATGPTNPATSQAAGAQDAVVSTLQDYTARISKFRAANRQDLILFRGQRDCDWALVPKIGRPDTRLKGRSQHDLESVEARLFDTFKEMSPPFLKRDLGSDLEWLAVAQHHGLPTRLLDWTRNAMAALWFAVRKEPYDEHDGAVWVLNPEDVDFTDREDEEAPFAIEGVKIYRPRHITERLIAQVGYFTLHRFSTENSRFKPLTEEGKLKHKLKRIVIARDAFSDLRDDLERCGVSDSTMFPDLDGICRYITWNNSLLKDETDPPNVLLNRD